MRLGGGEGALIGQGSGVGGPLSARHIRQVGQQQMGGDEGIEGVWQRGADRTCPISGGTMSS